MCNTPQKMSQYIACPTHYRPCWMQIKKYFYTLYIILYIKFAEKWENKMLMVMHNTQYLFNPPKHVLSLGHKTLFYAEGEAFLMTISKMKHAKGRRFCFWKIKKNVVKNAHLRAIDIAITTFYQKRTENFSCTDSGWDSISQYFDLV